MLPAEWAEMGGSICDDCSTCIQTEWCVSRIYRWVFPPEFAEFRAYVNAYGQAKSNAEFAKHWYVRP